MVDKISSYTVESTVFSAICSLSESSGYDLDEIEKGFLLLLSNLLACDNVDEEDIKSGLEEEDDVVRKCWGKLLYNFLHVHKQIQKRKFSTYTETEENPIKYFRIVNVL